MQPTRVQLIGYSGAGKSTLASTLATLYSLPVLHLDTVHFHGDWLERSLSEETSIVSAFLSQHQNWVIDGTYTRVCPERFARATLIIFLDFSRLFCLWSCVKRWWSWRGRTRGSSACVEKMDWEFVRWILWDGRTKEFRAKQDAILRAGEGEKLTFRTRREVEAWLAGLEKTR